MSINRVKDPQGRARFEFEFSRVVQGNRIRVRKRLPLTWTLDKANKYDIERTAKMYEEATGTAERKHLIDEAVTSYIKNRAPELKAGVEIGAEIMALKKYWTGKRLTVLAEVCSKITDDFRVVVAPATLKNRLRYLISACRHFWKSMKLGGDDPGAGIAMPAVNNKRHVYIDRGLMLAIAWHCEDYAARAAIRIAFYSGMRLGEIERAIRGNGVFVLTDTKNSEPRIVPMHPKVRCCVHFKQESRFKTGYHFRKARAWVGMEDFHFHDLRHSAASAMIDEDVDLYTVGAVLGHKSQTSTARYAHLAQRKLKAAVGQIGRRG